MPDILPRIAWRNELQLDAIVTATSAALGHDPVFATDDTLYRSWEPAAGGSQQLTVQWLEPRAISTWCVYGHTLGRVGAGIGFAWWDAGDNLWRMHPAGGRIFPEDGTCVYRTGPTVVTTGVRFVITEATAAPRIAALFAGTDLVCERGLAPGFVDPHLGQRQVVVHATSRSGLPLPAIVEDEYLEGQFALANVTLGWAKTAWLPFKRHGQTRPFYLRWHDDEPPAYCSGAQFANEVFSRTGHVSVGFTARMATR